MLKMWCTGVNSLHSDLAQIMQFLNHQVSLLPGVGGPGRVEVEAGVVERKTDWYCFF